MSSKKTSLGFSGWIYVYRDLAYLALIVGSLVWGSMFLHGCLFPSTPITPPIQNPPSPVDQVGPVKKDSDKPDTAGADKEKTSKNKYLVGILGVGLVLLIAYKILRKGEESGETAKKNGEAVKPKKNAFRDRVLKALGFKELEGKLGEVKWWHEGGISLLLFLIIAGVLALLRYQVLESTRSQISLALISLIILMILGISEESVEWLKRLRTPVRWIELAGIVFCTILLIDPALIEHDRAWWTAHTGSYASYVTYSIPVWNYHISVWMIGAGVLLLFLIGMMIKRSRKDGEDVLKGLEFLSALLTKLGFLAIVFCVVGVIGYGVWMFGSGMLRNHQSSASASSISQSTPTPRTSVKTNIKETIVLTPHRWSKELEARIGYFNWFIITEDVLYSPDGGKHELVYSLKDKERGKSLPQGGRFLFKSKGDSTTLTYLSSTERDSNIALKTAQDVGR